MGVEENETDDGQALVYRTPLFVCDFKNKLQSPQFPRLFGCGDPTVIMRGMIIERGKNDCIDFRSVGT
jgi:hypothetical protein